jgi:hypothetical protein
VLAAAALLSSVSTAFAEPPKIQPRSAWDPNNECQPRKGPDLGRVDLAIVHHSYIPNSEYTLEQVPERIRGIFNHHRNANGWDDIGYHFIVDKFGNAYEGRAGGMDKPLVGAHAYGYNRLSTGILVLGDHRTEPPSQEALTTVAKLIAWKLPLHGTPIEGTIDLESAGDHKVRKLHRVCGHRDTSATECPGQAFYDLLPKLREMVALEREAQLK